jgi:hypothetical protein
MDKIKVLQVPPDAPPAMGTIEPTLEELQRLVGGYIEVVRNSGHLALVDEEGRLKRLAPNVTASMVLNCPIVGTALFVGDAGEEFGTVPYPTVRAVAAASLTDAIEPITAAVTLLRANGYQVTEPRPDAEVRVRRNAPDTSHLVEPKLGTQMERVLRMIEKYQPITDDGIEDMIGLTHQSVSAARNALVRRGLVVDSGKRWPTRSGNKAIQWVTPDRYEGAGR